MRLLLLLVHNCGVVLLHVGEIYTCARTLTILRQEDSANHIMAGNIVSRMAFVPPRPASYSASLPGLFFVGVIPCVHYPFDFPHEITVLYNHGNAEDIGQARPLMIEMSQRYKINMVCYDYAGYGLHRETISSEGSILRDAELVYHHLITQCGIPSSALIIMGRSLGSGPATHLAESHDDCGGLILMSPITSAMRVVSPSLLIAFDYADIFCNIDKIGGVKRQVLIIHGDQDSVVPHAHGLDLSHRCGDKLWKFATVVGGTHNNNELLRGYETTSSILLFIDDVRNAK